MVPPRKAAWEMSRMLPWGGEVFPPDRTFPGPYLTRLSSLPDRTRNAACNNATVLLLSTVAWEAHRGLRPRGGTPRVGRRRRVRRSRGVAMSARIDALVFLLIHNRY